MPRNNKRYTGEFKQMVVEDMRNNRLGLIETTRKYEVLSKTQVANWERIYLEEGPAGLYLERRGHASCVCGVQKGRPPNFDKKIEEDLIAENQRLRMENDYLKKLNALVHQKELSAKRKKLK